MATYQPAYCCKMNPILLYELRCMSCPIRSETQDPMVCEANRLEVHLPMPSIFKVEQESICEQGSICKHEKVQTIPTPKAYGSLRDYTHI